MNMSGLDGLLCWRGANLEAKAGKSDERGQLASMAQWQAGRQAGKAGL